MMKYIYTNAYGDSIEFNRDSPFHITNVEGQSTNEVSLSDTYTMNQIGSTVSGRRVEPKEITVEGNFRDSFQNRSKILNTIIPGPGKLRYIDDDIDVYLDVEVTQTPDFEPKDKVYKLFDFELYAPFPYWKGQKKIDVEFTTFTPLFKFPRSFSNTVPWKIAEKKVKQIRTIFNESSFDSGFYLKMEAKADVQNPEILNIETQEKIKFLGFTMSPNDLIEVSTFENDKFVKLYRDGQEINIYNKMSDDSTFFKLKKGKNVIRFGADTNVENLIVSLSYEDIYMGV